ncbi:MAG: energy transducer TonB [Alcanivoracaceae bacterium]|nr:energy transducer TonB [Alcanivoracaceae bacterium]
MKTVLIFVFSIHMLSVYAQTDDETANQDNKPSWSEKMPVRSDTPDLNMDFEPDTNLDLDMGMTREALFDSDEDDEDTVTVRLEPEISEASKLVEQEKADEIAKLAEQEENAEKERIAEQQRIAEERQRSLDKLAAEQRIADQLAAEKLAEDNKAEQEITDTQDNNDQPEEIKAEFKWKKIKNVLPSYPVRAIRNNTEGWVSIELTISPAGDVISAHVADSFRNLKVFDNAALKAVKQWKFDPPSNYGIDTNQLKVVKIAFKL